MVWYGIVQINVPLVKAE